MSSRTENSPSVLLDPRAFSYYDLAEYDWDAATGEFGILVGTSSTDIRFRGKYSFAPGQGNH
ncbi:MAG TPA: fibronectin type III-like domain-contianing protein [Candidatus Acidoferrum sp.]|nr:fibronectin type III-like domain-contianing protein [Candidatus Acidoferrum sp.]